MRILPYIIAAMCLFQVSIYAQESAQVTLSIRLYPIQTMEVAPSPSQELALSSENTNNSLSLLSTFSTSQHTMYVDSVKTSGFEALHAVKNLPTHEHKSINKIFSDESYYYKDGDEDELNLVYCMEPL